MSYRDAFHQAADGLRLEYRDYVPAAASGKLPVLCLHGLTRNLRDFDDLAPMIAGTGRRVITVSQRGRGRSDHDPDPSHYTPAHYVGDMFGLLDALQIPEAVFIGTSMGGLMTMIAAAMAPGRVAAAVLNDIGPELDNEGLDRIKQYAGRSGHHDSWADATVYVRTVNEHAFPLETSESFWLDFARRTHAEGPNGEIVALCDPAVGEVTRDASAAMPDLWPFFDALKPVPTLLIRGGISDLLSKQTVAEMLRHNPDMTVCEVSQVGHAPFMTETEAWGALAAFLESAR
ncbi:alpha/beta fold hydrolase [Hyphobacterium marinum]|uniref:Alpha/beta hydrolase n=1 Tax=Hyphobacterium marinum TaxID=3116574 RepID=A0ABU7LVZ3_9PROT|nr:alpha/beta hydrolase [Hyphobacterium sp. Y6023]MEE2565700.1 alpha/beta hydrolase [Hyphobacterium sp. Y6023]